VIAATIDAIFFVERVEKPTDNKPAQCFATATDARSCLSCGKGVQSRIGPGARPIRAGANDYFDRCDWLGRSQGRLSEVSKLESHPREAAMPQIAVINESTAVSDADVLKMLPAFEQQWNKDLGPVWGVEAAGFAFVPTGEPPASGTWWVVFLDDSDQANALAYHDLTNEGLPISKVFVKTILADKASISVGATHEICEMAVDPGSIAHTRIPRASSGPARSAIRSKMTSMAMRSTASL
jgi:hypothetical protein